MNKTLEVILKRLSIKKLQVLIFNPRSLESFEKYVIAQNITILLKFIHMSYLKQLLKKVDIVYAISHNKPIIK
jgi:hypothetical protein